MEKGRNGSVLLKDNLLGWVDSAAITSVKGAYFSFHISPSYSYHQIFFMIGFLIAGFTNVINLVIHHHLLPISALVLPPKSPIVHVGRTLLLPTLLLINLSTHSHFGIIAPLPSPHAILSAQNPTLLVLIHAKQNATPVPVLHVQFQFFDRADVDL